MKSSLLLLLYFTSVISKSIIVDVDIIDILEVDITNMNDTNSNFIKNDLNCSKYDITSSKYDINNSKYDLTSSKYDLTSSKYDLTNNVTCSLCKSLVATIDYAIIKGNQTIEEITKVIKDICCMIKGPRGRECVFVLDNIQEIIKYISDGLTSIQICKKLNLCY